MVLRNACAVSTIGTALKERTGSSCAVLTVPPFDAWALDRLGHLTTLFELSSLTRGRVMPYATPAVA
ncbi:hypothetical protein [Streptomyces sp. NPDC005890]|uniref:hypothetical protein n=1 Tax=Streptomyces sp. NPDC005890 TaxID=3154568 RepID=UPI0033C17A03